MVITGGILVPDSESIRESLEFINPFDEGVFKAYLETNNGLVIPRGFPVAVQNYTKSWIETYADIKVSESYQLRGYQEPVVDAITDYFLSREYGQCLLQAETGSGKSFSLAGILSKLNRKTLILSHLTMLGDQMGKELASNLSSGSIGEITAASLGKDLPDIGITSFKMLENTELLKYVSEHYSCVVVDEMENALTPTRLRVLLSLKPQYQLYLTATPSKELVQQTKAVQYMYDTVFVMKQPEDVRIHSKHIMADFRHLNWESPQNPMMYKVSLGRFITKSEILPWVVLTCKKLKERIEGTIWIVADLNKVQDQLKLRLEKQDMTIGIIRGNTKKKERLEILKAIEDGTLDVLIGSAPLSAGLSIPQLAIGIRLMPSSSSEELLEQQRGRLNRNCYFKKYQYPLWIDLAISGSLLYNARKRFDIYKRTTFGARMIKPQNLVEEALKEIL